MKYISLLIIIFGLSSCTAIDKFTQFDLPYTAETNIPASLGINLPFDLPTPPIKSNVEKTYTINNTKKDLVEEITMKSLKISTSGENNFNFLKKIKIFINADGLDEIEIASKSDIGNNKQEIELEVNMDDNLMDYINKDEFSLKVQPVTKKVLFHEVDLKIDALFHVNARVLGI